MTKPLWESHFEAEAEKLEAEVQHRREIAEHDNVAAGIEWAAKRLRRAIGELANAHALLTPAQWGAMQPKRVPEQTVRRWARNGELPWTDGARGILIPAGAKRVKRESTAHLSLTGS